MTDYRNDVYERIRLSECIYAINDDYIQVELSNFNFDKVEVFNFAMQSCVFERIADFIKRIIPDADVADMNDVGFYAGISKHGWSVSIKARQLM